MLLEDRRLAAPTDTTTVAPDAVAPTFDGTPADGAVDETERDYPPGFLVQAQGLAERNVESSAAHARLAHAQLLTGDRDGAIRSAKSSVALVLTDRDTPALVSAAGVLLALDSLDGAEEVLLQYADEPGVAALLSHVAAENGDFRTALARLRSLEDPVSRAMRGWLLLQLRDYQKAIHELRQSVRDAPSPSAYTNLGYAYGALGLLAKAIAATRVATSLAPADRTASFNLVSFLVAAGEYDFAVSELARLREYHADDLKVTFAHAHVEWRRGHRDQALALLRRSRSTKAFWSGPEDERAELNGNIAFLEYQTGKRSAEDAAAALQKALIESQYRSRGLARLLCAMLNRTNQAKQLEALYEAMLRDRRADEIYDIEARLATLKCDYARALEVGRRWAAESPFDEDAAILVTYLLAEFAGKYAEAAKFGSDALERFPASVMLRNNTAYALVMAGRTREALRVLPRTTDNACVVATRALARLADGDVEGALQGYADAQRVADEAGDSRLSAMIGLRLAFLRLDLAESPRRDLDVSEELKDDPAFVLLSRAQLVPRRA